MGVFEVVIILVLIAGFVFLGFKKNDNSDAETIKKLQAELMGRVSQMVEMQGSTSKALSDSINDQKLSTLKIMDEKLNDITKRVGQGLNENTEKTGKTLQDLRERLAKIDSAQQKISTLSEQVVGLQEVLSNKQARGAFGEVQLNDLVTSILPPSAYEFQATLSNSKRADCLLTLPNPPGSIVIDAKFPLESYHQLRNAKNDNDKIIASRAFGADILKHVKDISEKYIVNGETAESALMFLPSEAVYAELHANFSDVVDRSYKSKVWIVSPTTLMATLNTIRAILKDANMREQASVIQKEVMVLFEDIKRLDERVEKLRTHFNQANKDIDLISTSSSKIASRVVRIEKVQLGDDTHLLDEITSN